MQNAKTTISGVLAILIPILNLLYKFLSGMPIDPADMKLTMVGVPIGYGLIAAKDAQTPETVISQPVQPSGPMKVETKL